MTVLTVITTHEAMIVLKRQSEALACQGELSKPITTGMITSRTHRTASVTRMPRR